MTKHQPNQHLDRLLNMGTSAILGDLVVLLETDALWEEDDRFGQQPSEEARLAIRSSLRWLLIEAVKPATLKRITSALAAEAGVISADEQ